MPTKTSLTKRFTEWVECWAYSLASFTLGVVATITVAVL